MLTHESKPNYTDWQYQKPDVVIEGAICDVIID